MSRELLWTQLALLRTDGGSTTRVTFGLKRAGLLVLDHPAFDGGEADAEDAGHLGFGATAATILLRRSGEYAFTSPPVK